MTIMEEFTEIEKLADQLVNDLDNDFCMHEQTDEEDIEFGNDPDKTFTNRCLVCRKCGAIKPVIDDGPEPGWCE